MDELWRRCRAGDREAREELILAYQDHARRIALTVGLYPTVTYDLDDIASQGYLGLVKAVDGFNPDKGVGFGTYLYACVRGLVLRGKREAHAMGSSAGRAREKGVDVDDVTVSLDALPVDPRGLGGIEDEVVSRLTMERALAKLEGTHPAEARSLLRYVNDGMESRDVAEVEGCTVAVASTRLYRARAALRQVLAA